LKSILNVTKRTRIKKEYIDIIANKSQALFPFEKSGFHVNVKKGKEYFQWCSLKNS